MPRMDRSVAWRAALLQALLVTAVAVALAVALPRSFFEDWGWLAGPAAWRLRARAGWLCGLAGARGRAVGAADAAAVGGTDGLMDVRLASRRAVVTA